MKTLACFLLLLALTLTAAATDISGKWSGTFNVTFPDGRMEEHTAYLILQQKGNEITGTAGPNDEDQREILNGKIDGAKISFDVKTDREPIKFAVTLEGEHLKGDASQLEEGQTIKAKLDATRVK